ncbi:glycosyltransferase [Anabaena sphaerica FACHB-251]|uniref:Glycosyltransferase n=1 Tax=Anabaena sphaerica FACHB-251 TaxID=2692883 RepID=A0A926WCP9_9NOST|nr:glycosyltransferase [Anabaena sphaerica]MBD2292149.1 glycosyltransferase [Anabaena sphaerica FACHB-251]
MKRVVLITGHYWSSKRKAGFHWLADAFLRQGWEVVFFTAPLSWLSVIRQDYRLDYPVLQEANKLQQVETTLWSYIWFTLWHPANLRLNVLNSLSHGLFRLYSHLPLGPVASMIEDADLFIFESTPAILLFESFKRINPSAKFIYRVSDDLRLLNNHPVVLETEQQIASEFDLVSVPSQYIYRNFPGLPNLELHFHGIRKDLFDQEYANPYPTVNHPNIIFVGNSYFDTDFIAQASQLFPNWQFHIIGPIKNLPARKNIISYGELPFIATIPYIKYADIALQTLVYSHGSESFTDSLKMIQYTYCQLPIIAPVYLSSSKTHVFYYQPGDVDSIRNALLAAQSYKRDQIQTDQIYSWDELVNRFLELTNNNSAL